MKSVGQRIICGTKNRGLSSIVLKKGAFQNLPSRWRWGWKSAPYWGLGLRFRGWMGYECTVVNLRLYSYIMYARTLVALRPYTCRVFNRTLVEIWMVSNTLHSSNPLICSEKRKSFIFPVFQIKYFPAENTGIMVRFSWKSVYFYLCYLSPDCPAERKLSISTARTNKRLHTA